MHHLANPADSIAGHPLDRLLADQTYSANGIRSLTQSIQDDSFEDIQTALVDLCVVLDELEKKYEFKEPVHDRRQGITYLRCQSEVIYPDDQLPEIHNLIAQTRQLIITP
jgi:hypothetical protein